jgi:hypothetical protein
VTQGFYFRRRKLFRLLFAAAVPVVISRELPPGTNSETAERFLSEGNGKAARIRGKRIRDLNKIQSEACREVEEIRGLADAKATEIYARAYNQNAESIAFYEFTRTKAWSRTEQQPHEHN